jgi:hypothetical protein
MPHATDAILLTLAPGLAQAQIVEFRVKVASDGDWQIDLDGIDPLIFAASGHTIPQIRDGLAALVISPDADPYTVKTVVGDRLRIKGTPGDPFDFAFLPPGGIAQGTATVAQKARGATTALRLAYLQIAQLLILEGRPGEPGSWGAKTQAGQAWLTAFLLERAIAAQAAFDGLAAGGVASSLSLGGASASLSGAAVMPTAAELSTSTTYGTPFLLLLKSIGVGPIWSR